MASSSNRHDFWEKKAATSPNEYLKYMVGEETLDNAQEIHESDATELVQYLPDLEGKDVLELASGVGRFTGELAKRAKHVTSTDFMEFFVQENKSANRSKYNNITFETLDATKIYFSTDSFDFVIGLWLLQFLNDIEIIEFLSKILRILRPGGYLFLRDSHHSMSSVLSRQTAGQCRTLIDYFTFYTKSFSTDNGNLHFFKLDYCYNSKTWVTSRRVPTVFNYRLKNVSTTDHTVQSLNPLYVHFDSRLYNEELMSVYKNVISDGFATPGGLMATEKFCSNFATIFGGTTQSLNVIDIGCGLGGCGLHLLQNYNADVIFLEQSVFACDVLALKLKKLQLSKGQIVITDITDIPDIPNICSCNCVYLIHTMDGVKDKQRLLLYTKQSLIPNGVVFIGTFCLTAGQQPSERLTQLMELEGLQLITVERYKKIFDELCYSKVTVEDYSLEYLSCITECITRLDNDKGNLNSDKDAFHSKWTILKEALQNKELTWIHLTITL